MAPIVALLLALIFTTTACSSSSNKGSTPAPAGGEQKSTETETKPASKFGGEIRIGTLADVGNFNPLVTNSISDFWVLNLMYPQLLVLNEKGEKVGSYAKEWRYEDGGKKAIFVLREDAVWDDGTPFTSADVKFTAETIMKDKIGLAGGMLTDVTSVEAPDKKTVVFNLKQPYGPFLTTVGFWMRIVPKHIWEKVPNVKEFPNAENFVGIGPFKLTKYEKGQYYELTRTEKYALVPEGKAYLEKVQFRVYPDINTAILALKKGDIDAMANPIPPASVKDLEGTKGITLSKTPSLGYVHMTYNVKNQHLAKQEVRQALIHATNKDAIQKIVLLGNAKSLPTVVSPVLSDYFDPSIKDYAFDPNKAKELLTKAGYKDGNGDGLFDGLELNMIYNQASANITRWAKIVADDAAKAGVKINPQGLEPNTYLAKAREHDFDIYAGNWGIMDEPADYFALLFLPDAFINYGQVNDPKLVEMINAARYELDKAKVVAAVNALQKYVHEQAYVNTLYVEEFNLAYNTEKFAGWKIYPSELKGFIDPEALSLVHKK